MKQEYPWRLLVGIGLVAAGVLALLQTLGMAKIGEWGWLFLFVMGGMAFLSVTLRNRAAWWGVIPGVILIAMAGEIALGMIQSPIADVLGGAVMLGGIGLAFWLVYFLNRSNWWAIIPGGTLFTMAVVAVLSNANGGLETGGIFMLGLAATFALVALLTAGTDHSMRWAWYPAAALAVIGLLAFFSALNLMGYIWGIALILVGGLLAWRALRK